MFSSVNIKNCEKFKTIIKFVCIYIHITIKHCYPPKYVLFVNTQNTFNGSTIPSHREIELKWTNYRITGPRYRHKKERKKLWQMWGLVRKFLFRYHKPLLSSYPISI